MFSINKIKTEALKNRDRMLTNGEPLLIFILFKSNYIKSVHQSYPLIGGIAKKKF